MAKRIICVALLCLMASPPSVFGGGLFGRRRVSTCYARPVHQRALATPIYNDTDVFVIQNNAAAPLIAQGATTYRSVGYQAAVLPFFDPNTYFAQEQQLQKAASEAAVLRTVRASALVERVVALQAPAVERLAAGQAAQMVLEASGLAGFSPPAPSATGVVITRDASGNVVVRQVDPAQAAAYATQGATSTTTTSTHTGTITGTFPLATKFCGNCHGTQLDQPKGGFYLGDSARVVAVMQADWFKITKRVGNSTMPPPSSPQPTREQRVGLLNELEQIITAAD